MDGKDFVEALDMKRGLVYNCSVENEYLNGEIAKCLYKRDGLDAKFGEIINRLNHLEKDGRRNVYDKGVCSDVVRLKEIVDRIEYYDILIADYKRHIEHNNRLIVKKTV